MRNMITEDKRGLVIFRNGIDVDRALPKHINIDAELKRLREAKKPGGSSAEITEGSSILMPDTPLHPISMLASSDWGEEYGGLKRGDTYEELLGLDVHGINILMGEKLRTRIFEPDSGFDGNRRSIINPVILPDDESEIPQNIKTLGALKRFMERLRRLRLDLDTREGEPVYSLDVLEFFAQIKGIAKNSPEANTYIDRTRGYIQALKNADAAGQTALKERLLGGLIMNKYESALYAVGKYYVVEEAQVVEFARRCAKGLSLTYLKNYLRPLPPEVVATVGEMNAMEIFDNYVILHYDPERKSFEETFKEKERRRDPILFGVIKGSKRLYYVTDWIDEYCDLTLEKFAEVLQKSKDDFKMSEKGM